jgi:putative restriction endonuclease
MPSLPNRVLFARLRAALPAGSRFESAAESIHPAIVQVPGFGRARIYLWTVTPDRSAEGARPAGEFKIQLIIPDQARTERGHLDLDGTPTYLLGFSPDFGVFVGWEARLYGDFAFSANVQVREEILSEARNSGWAVAPPRPLRRAGAEEVRVGFTPGNLVHFLRVSREADHGNLTGKWREAFCLSRTPNVQTERLPRRERDLEEFVSVERARLAATRLQRDSRFGPKVREQFSFACAVCSLQLEIVESAHIIPVNEPDSSDEIWNGVALCPNHHTLFDANSFLVNPHLEVVVDAETVEFLRENDRDGGINVLVDFDRSRIRPPSFWDREPRLRGRMQGALGRRLALSGVAATGP